MKDHLTRMRFLSSVMRVWLGTLFVAVVVFFPVVTWAQGPSPNPDAQPAAQPSGQGSDSSTALPAPAPDRLTLAQQSRKEAADLFNAGVDLLQRKSYSGALAKFMASLRLDPSWDAAANAANCLIKLERFDEALDMLQLVLKDFQDIPEVSKRLPEAAKRQTQEQVIAMRQRTGVIAIDGAPLGATLMIDGRHRGEYPSADSITVMSGERTVRVYKEGFQPFETTVKVGSGGKQTRVSVQLQPLVNQGRLSVTERAGKQVFDVLLDGFLVGQTPWEGPVEVGNHRVWLRSQDSLGVLGTLPQEVSVQRNQRLELPLSAVDLNASIKIVPEPGSASVAIDGLFVGRGIFEGRVRPGKHTIRLEAEGYFQRLKEVNVTAGNQPPVVLGMQKDPNHPMWKEPGRFTLEIGMGLTLSPSLGGAISNCQDPCSQAIALGSRQVFHGGYELANGFGFGIQVGYWTVSQDTTSRPTQITAVGRVAPNEGLADDTISARGLALGAFGALRLVKVAKRFPVRFRLGLGVAFGSVSDIREGTFRVSDQSVEIPYQVGPVIESPSVTWLYIDPEVRMGMRFGDHIELSLGVSVPFFITPDVPTWNAEHPINASADGYGRFDADSLTDFVVYSITPGLGARYDF